MALRADNKDLINLFCSRNNARPVLGYKRLAHR